MEVWVLVTATTATATAHVVTQVFGSWEAVVTHLWVRRGLLSPTDEQTLAHGDILPTEEGWLLCQKHRVVGVPKIMNETKTDLSAKNRADAVKGLRQLGFKAETADAAVDAAILEMGLDDFDRMFTRSLQLCA